MLRVLIVEDDRGAANALELYLSRRGHQVKIAGDGSTALELARREPPDVALVDIGLPGATDGCEVARQLKGMAQHKFPVIIAVTGRAEDEVRTCAAGIDFHLVKPIELEALDKMLERFDAVMQR